MCSMLGSSAVMEGGIKQNNGLDIYQACSTALHCTHSLVRNTSSKRTKQQRASPRAVRSVTRTGTPSAL